MPITVRVKTEEEVVHPETTSPAIYIVEETQTVAREVTRDGLINQKENLAQGMKRHTESCNKQIAGIDEQLALIDKLAVK